MNGHATSSSLPHYGRAHKSWTGKDRQVTLDGSSLTLSDFIAIASLLQTPRLDPSRRSAMAASVDHLESQRKAGNMIYGINVPYGAAAYTTLSKEKEHETVDRGLITLLNGDVGDVLQRHGPARQVSLSEFGNESRLIMPEAWVRGSMVLRINALLQSASACRWEVCENLVDMLDKRLCPVIPIRNSISASGDLSPLAYITYAMAGSNKVQILHGNTGQILPADKALAAAKVSPFVFRPKEVLACINGTGASTSVAALALNRLHRLAFASHAITAVMSEATLASPSFIDSYLHDVARPHPGQCEVAAVLRGLLKGSSLMRQQDEDPLEFIWNLTVKPVLEERFGKGDNLSAFDAPKNIGQSAPGYYLRQDRYHMRCSPQYAGPALEELCSAHDIIQIEFNSVTDNPILKPDGNVIHGGNFQASSIGLSAEKMRDVAVTLGRLMHEQLLAVIDPSKNNALPAYLAMGDPAMVGGIRAMDIASSSYLAELTFLSNRLVHFNRSAECGNQSINSMALASARYTMEALDVLCTMTATSLYAACQALDCRRLTLSFFTSLSGKVLDIFKDVTVIDVPAALQRDCLYTLFSSWNGSWLFSLEDRIRRSLDATVPQLGMWIMQNAPQGVTMASASQALSTLSTSLAELLRNEWTNHLTQYIDHSPNLQNAYLGEIRHANGPLQILRYIREKVGIKLDSGLETIHSNAPEHYLTSYGDQITFLAQALRSQDLDELWASLGGELGV